MRIMVVSNAGLAVPPMLYMRRDDLRSCCSFFFSSFVFLSSECVVARPMWATSLVCHFITAAVMGPVEVGTPAVAVGSLASAALPSAALLVFVSLPLLRASLYPLRPYVRMVIRTLETALPLLQFLLMAHSPALNVSISLAFSCLKMSWSGSRCLVPWAWQLAYC